MGTSTRRPGLRVTAVLITLLALLLGACTDDGGTEDAAEGEETAAEESGDGGDAAEEEPGGTDEAADDGEAEGGELVFEVPAEYDGPEADLPTEYAEPESCDATIGWQNPLAANENLVAQERAVVHEVERLGGEVVTLDDRVDPDTQVSNMQQLLGQDVDAIGFLPIDPGAVDPVLAQAGEAGVPVLAIERTLTVDEEADDVATQVWQSRDIQAWRMASLMAESEPDGQVAIIGFAVPVPSIDFLVERIDFWASELGLEVVHIEESPTDDSAGGEEAMNTIVAQYPDIDGLLAYNDPTALGAAAVARGSGLEGLTIVGNNGGEDGLSGVEAGQLAGTFQNDAIGIGIQSARGLCALAEDPDADVPPVVVRPPSEAITPENVDASSTWEEQLETLGAE